MSPPDGATAPGRPPCVAVAKPIWRRGREGGSSSRRIAWNILRMHSWYVATVHSRSASFAASSAWPRAYSPSRTNARTTKMLISTAPGLRSPVAAMVAPCVVLSDAHETAWAYVALNHLARGDEAAARRIAGELVEWKQTHHVSSVSIAQLLAELGDSRFQALIAKMRLPPRHGPMPKA